MSWTSILEGRVWEASTSIRGGWPLRSVAVELATGGVAVLSPSRGLDIDALIRHAGDVRFLVAANHFHYLGIPEWLAACPGAVPIATDVALPRLAKKVDIAWSQPDDLVGALASDTTLLIPEGTASGEAWLSVERGPTRIWIVCDAYFNLETLPRGVMGAFCKVSRTGPGLSIGQTWKYVQLRDRKRYKAWLLARLAAAPPTVLVPSHGEIVRGDDLGERLAAHARARL
ncbi:MAG TPA: hypothetical protein VL400_03950 [Polyangiaceae bacterium]|nr:hypothetical protein [Polyangiaceae bacterium]